MDAANVGHMDARSVQESVARRRRVRARNEFAGSLLERAADWQATLATVGHRVHVHSGQVAQRRAIQRRDARHLHCQLDHDRGATRLGAIRAAKTQMGHWRLHSSRFSAIFAAQAQSARTQECVSHTPVLELVCGCVRHRFQVLDVAGEHDRLGVPFRNHQVAKHVDTRPVRANPVRHTHHNGHRL